MLSAIKNLDKVDKSLRDENKRELEDKEQKPPVKPIKTLSTPRKKKSLTPMMVYDDLIKFCKESDNTFAKTILGYCEDKRKHQRSTVLYAIEILMMMGRIK